MVAKRVLVCLFAMALALTLSACNESEGGISGPNSPSKNPDAVGPPVVAFTSATYSVSQSAGAVTISVGRTGASSGTSQISYSTSDGTAKGGSDYTAANGTLTWSNGDLSPKTFTVAVSNATPFVGARSFNIALANASNATVGSPARATVTINGSGSNAPGTVQFSSGSYEVAQAGGSVTLSVSRTGGANGAISVHYATANGTATAGKDYTAASGTLSWASGDTSAKTFRVAISSATAFTGSKNFTATLSATGGGATLGSPATATTTIDGAASTAAGVLSFAAPSYAISQAGGALTIHVSRTGGTHGTVSVHYATANGSATGGKDYTATSGTLTWADGDASAKSFAVAISNATPFTGTRTFSAGLSGATGGATLGSPASTTATITGSASTATGFLGFASSSYGVSQSGGQVTISVARTGGSSGAASVSFSTADGTAKAGTDYTATSGTLSWASGDATVKSFTVAVSNATPFSGARTFSVNLSGATGAKLGTPASTTATITGAGAAGMLSFSSSTYGVAQTAGTVTISVARTSGANGAVSVSFSTADGTAKAGTDYSAKSGTLSWGNGDASAKTFTVAVSNQKPFTGTRNFSVNLAGPTNKAGLRSPMTAMTNITGSQAATPGTLSFASSSYGVAQTAGAVTISVARMGGSSGAVSVAYATANGTATAGRDYTAASGTLSWADGDAAAKSFTVAVSNATPFNGTRSFNVGLSGAGGGATLGSPSSATATITGSAAASPGKLALSASTYSVAQSGGSLSISVARSGGSSGAVSVAYATADGTAKAGSDYTAASGTLNWADGDAAAKSFTVAVNNATPFTGSRNFTLSLSGPGGGATLGSPSSATATINGGAATSGACAKNSSSWTTTGAFDSKAYGNYFVNNNNWGGTPGQQFWSNDENCWGVTTTATHDNSSIGSYPSVTRGWSQNATIMQQQGGNGWTVQSGMGIPVSQLTKAKVHWQFNAPTTSGIRWLGLMDNYFHSTNNPSPSQFPPVVDLMVDQSIADQVVNGSTFYALVAQQDHGSTVTISGVQYVFYIDDSDENAYHSAGGHTIHLFRTPSAFTSGTALAIWGTNDGVTDLAAIVKFFMQSNPVDDNGAPIKTATGATVTTPLISPDLYFNAINAGWEIDDGTVFTNTGFCVAMQSEADCP